MVNRSDFLRCLNELSLFCFRCSKSEVEVLNITGLKNIFVDNLRSKFLKEFSENYLKKLINQLKGYFNDRGNLIDYEINKLNRELPNTMRRIRYD